MNLQKKFEQLRSEYPVFYFNGYTYAVLKDEMIITFDFSAGEKLKFSPIFRIPFTDTLCRNRLENKQVLSVLIFHIGLIEMLSYWKSVCSPKIILKTGSLDEKQIRFWKNLYYLGLGEFRYLNGITVNEDEFVTFESTGKQKITDPFIFSVRDNPLVPVGGGKDSIVSLMLLKKAGKKILPYAINPGKAIISTIEAAGYNHNDLVSTIRSIDPHLLTLNENGFLNGHTPFSAALAFHALLVAFLTGSGSIVLSNESSANEPTIPGTSINHQFSKSFIFEKQLRDYISVYISPNIKYYSILRPWSELQIAAEFSRHTQFFPHFRSCNAGSKTGDWCGKCPKCLFTFTILSPFIEPSILINIFNGRNLFEDPCLVKTLEKLTGFDEEKPFECVGTIKEVRAALHYTILKHYTDDLPLLLKAFVSKCPEKEAHINSFYELLDSFNEENFLDKKEVSLLKSQNNGSSNFF